MATPVDEGVSPRPQRSRSLSTLSSFPSGHVSLAPTREELRPQPLPKYMSPLHHEASMGNNSSTTSYPTAHCTPETPYVFDAEPARNRKYFITSPSTLKHEVNRDADFVFNAILRLQAKCDKLREDNTQLREQVESAQHDATEILKDYTACFAGFIKLCDIKDQKLAIVFTQLARNGQSDIVTKFGWTPPKPAGIKGFPVEGPQSRNGAVKAELEVTSHYQKAMRTGVGDSPLGVEIAFMPQPLPPQLAQPLVGPPPFLNQTAEKLRDWRVHHTYHRGRHTKRNEENIQEEEEADCSFGPNSAYTSFDSSKDESDAGSTGTQLDPNADEFIPTKGSGSESITPKCTNRGPKNTSILDDSKAPHILAPSTTFPPPSTARTDPSGAHVLGTYTAYKFQSLDTTIPSTAYPALSTSDQALHATVAALPARFFNICPFSLSDDAACPLGFGCKLQHLCPDFVHGKTLRSDHGRGDCRMVHELRSCEKEVEGKVCGLADVDGPARGGHDDPGRGGSGRGSGGMKTGRGSNTANGRGTGGMGDGTSERAHKHLQYRAHKGSVSEEDWKQRVVVAGLRGAHREGKY